jgi:hypothetical protein
MKVSYDVIKPQQYQSLSVETELEQGISEIATKAVVGLQLSPFKSSETCRSL